MCWRSRFESPILRCCGDSPATDQPAPAIRRCARHDMTDRRDMPDMSDSTLANEPTDSTDAAEPTLPMLNTEPMLPMLSSEFVEPMLSIDPRDRWLRRDIDARVS